MRSRGESYAIDRAARTCVTTIEGRSWSPSTSRLGLCAEKSLSLIDGSLGTCPPASLELIFLTDPSFTPMDDVPDCASD